MPKHPSRQKARRPNIGGALLNGLASLVLLADSALTALVAMMTAGFRRGGLNRGWRLLMPVAGAIVGALAVAAIIHQLSQDQIGAERRALEQRQAELAAQTLAPGSALACLDAGAGETVENGCEKAVFADPKSTAAAVSYTAARLTLLADALGFARRADPAYAERFAGLRRAIERDRFGIAAHVLALREGCTARQCTAFGLLQNASAIKANLRARTFNQFVARYAAIWGQQPAIADAPEIVFGAPFGSTPHAAAAEPNRRPVAEKYDFPSADSIPAVNIMAPEPRLPKGESANAAVTGSTGSAAARSPRN